MRRFLCILSLVAAILVAAGQSAQAGTKTFTVATGLVDNSMDKTTPTTNLGTYATLWLTPIVPDSGFASFAHLGDFSIDDTMAAAGVTHPDSCFIMYTRDRIYYSTLDSVFLWPIGVYGSRDWSETQETWNQWKTGSNWVTPGGDTTGIIAKIDTLGPHTADIRDTIVVRRGVLGGSAWLDSACTATGNTGVILACRENQVGADAKVAQVEIFSTEDATDANRPVFQFFNPTAGGTPLTKRRRG